MSDDGPLGELRLDRISTHFASVCDAERFFLRYGQAIEAYLRAILRDADAAEEVRQDLVAALLDRRGPARWPGKGRFRDYLKTCARNAALTYLRKNKRPEVELSSDPAARDHADRECDSQWQGCLLEKVWRELELHERRSAGSLAYTALRVFTELPDETSPRQAEVVSERAGRRVTAEAFRQQVSRGKRLMAELILIEVARTTARATAEDVEGELTELGLMTFVSDYLPADWREQFFGGP